MITRFDQLKAQETFKRAAEIAIAGGHKLALLPFEAAPYSFDRALLNRPECRERWDAFGGKPWSADAATLEIHYCWLARDSMYRLTGRAISQPGTVAVTIAPLGWADLLMPPPAEPDEAVAKRILDARARLLAMSDAMTYDARALLESWQKHFPGEDPAPHISIARTIAALAEAPEIGRVHIAEALSYREPKP